MEDRIRDLEKSAIELRSRVDHLSADVKNIGQYIDGVIKVQIKLDALEKSVEQHSKTFEEKIRSANYVGWTILCLLVATLVKLIFFGGVV